MKEIKDDTNRWRDISCSWIGRINIIKITVLPNAVYRFNASSIRLPVAFFFSHRIRTKILQFVWEHIRPQIAKAVLKKKNGAGGIGLLAFRLDYKATVIQTVWYCHKNRNIYQWNRVKVQK